MGLGHGECVRWMNADGSKKIRNATSLPLEDDPISLPGLSPSCDHSKSSREYKQSIRPENKGERTRLSCAAWESTCQNEVFTGKRFICLFWNWKESINDDLEFERPMEMETDRASSKWSM